MRLRDEELKDPSPWERARIKIPNYDRAAMIRATMAQPQWVHFGSGNIFRIFPAVLMDELLERGLEQRGIIMVAGRNGDIVDQVFRPCDNLSLGVTIKLDGTQDRRVIASIAESFRMDRKEDNGELQRIFRHPSLQMASFTITEKAYNSKDPTIGEESHYLSRVTALLMERYRAGKLPLTLVSMDNCSHNGDKLFGVITGAAEVMVKKGQVDGGFLDYIRDPKVVSFPWTMIDKIVPSPDKQIKEELEKTGFLDTGIYQRQTVSSPFVNAEDTQYLVIEDAFPNGRPRLEEGGVFFTDRETVDRCERMKVSACLNPLHSTLAIFGCLLSYTFIYEALENPILVKLVETLGYKEGMPVVEDPGIIDPGDFIEKVIKERLPNPFLRDTTSRIAVDLSQKIPVRFGETLKAYQARPDLSMENLKIIPLVFAGWLRYLLGINDQGQPFMVSSDPRYEELKKHLGGIKLGDRGPFTNLRPILSDPSLFGLDLYSTVLGERVEKYLEELLTGPGAVAETVGRSVY